MINTLTKLAILPFVLYLIFLIALHFQPVQRELLFFNWLSFPNPETLKTPSLYGFPENQARNFYIETQQNRKIGVWQVIPIESYWKEISQDNKEFNDKFYDSFFTNKSTTTLIYLHGNVGNRASLHRPFTYQELADKNQFNVVTIDYAGFGDSEGKPTEKSVVEDSKAIWDWLIKKGASPDRLIIMGHSLGSAIATKLTEQLQSEKTLPKALMLKAPFSNVKRAMFDFKLFGRLGVLGPLGRVPQFKNYITKVLKLDFDSLSIINKLNLPILILHGYQDKVLPIVHGEDLFEQVLNSSNCKTNVITKGLPQNVEVLSSVCKNHLIQFAKFNYIGHSNYHRFDSAFLVIQKFLDMIN